MKSIGKIKAGFNQGQAVALVANEELEFAESQWKGVNAPVVGERILVEKLNGVLSSVRGMTEEELIKHQSEVETEKLKNMSRDVITIAEAILTKYGFYAYCVLLGSIFFTNAIEFFEPFSKKTTIGITFYDLIGLINSGNLAYIGMTSSTSKGVMGFLLLASLTGPFWSKFTKDARAYLGFCAPLVFSAYLLFSSYKLVKQTIPAVSEYVSKELAQKMMNEAIANIHLGIGAYGIGIAATYLAIIGIKKFLVAKALQQ